MRRRGQIFLLLTILSITFIFAVSTILLDIQRAQYLEPSPDIDETFEAWDNTVYSIEQILDIQIAINTQAGSTSRDYGPEIRPELDSLENYLLSRGLIASINLDGVAQYTQPATGGIAAIASITATVSVQIESSSGNSIKQTLGFAIQYAANVDDGTDTLYLTKTVNGITSYIRGAFFNVGGITDNGNGVYDLPAPAAIIITTPNNLELDVATT